MLIAHLTDLHLPIPAPPALRALFNKRALGFLSWQRKRQHRHSQDALEALVRDLKAQAPDHTLITGDIVNIALPAEFAAAAAWLDANFDPAATAFIPGNHDTYVPLGWETGAGALAAFMAGRRLEHSEPRKPAGYDDFPYYRVIGDVGVIMANSSPSTAPGLATGTLGGAQITRIGAMLRKFGDDGLFRILALHHPAAKGAVGARKALTDQAALQSCLEEAGAELVIHGHMHRPLSMVVGARKIPVIGAGSASHGGSFGDYPPAQYNLYRIDKKPDGGWRASMEIRELDPASQTVHSVKTQTFS